MLHDSNFIKNSTALKIEKLPAYEGIIKVPKLLKHD